MKHIIWLTALCFIWVQCNIDFENLSQEEKAWLVDEDNDGVGDSIQFYAPGCKLTLEECLAVAKSNREVYILEIEKMDEYRPVFSVDSGTYNRPVSLELSTDVIGATIYYTLNGDTASKLSDKYLFPLQILKTTTVFAVVFDENGRQLSTQSSYTFIIDLEGVALPPEFSPSPGTYNNTPKVILSSLSENSVIRYTLDGTVPTELSQGYSATIDLERSTTIRAKTFAADLDPSPIVNGPYELEVAMPVADVDSGTYRETQIVTLSSISPLATIRYTTDGSEPNENSTQAILPITLSSSTTLKAKGFRAGWTSSKTLEHSYVIKLAGRVAEPVIFPYNGPFSRAVEVEITCETEGATIHYTLDGSQPTDESPIYTDKILVDGNLLLTAIAYHPDLDESGTVQFLYSFKVQNPVITSEVAASSTEYTITINTATAGAEIYYSMDGSEPAKASTKYSGPFKISQSTNIRAIAFKENWLQSEISSQSFFITIEGTVASPLISPEFARKEGSQVVTMSVGTEDAKIYYTTNGLDPTENATLYTGEIVVDKTLQIKARAYADSLDPSSVSLATYYISAYAPQFSPQGGTFLEPTYVKVSSQTKGAAIYYTTDGSDPDTNSNVYMDSILINSNLTLKAIAFLEDLEPSTVSGETYIIQNSKVSAPVFKPQPGSFLTSQILMLETETEEAEILFTLDGTNPSPGSNGTLVYDSASPPQISVDTRVTAVAVKSNWTNSDTVAGDYVIADEGTATLISPNGGEKWVVGSTHNITWATSAGVATVDLNLVSDSTAPVSIASDLENTGSYSWTIPNSPGRNYRVVVSIPSQGIDTSDAEFEILALQAVNRFEWATHASSPDLAEGITPVMDAQGNTIVAGTYNSSVLFAGSNDIELNKGLSGLLFLAKYDKNGDCLWARDAGNQIIQDISLTTLGDIIVGGYHNANLFLNTPVPFFGSEDAFVASYSSDGHLQWINKVGGLGDDYAYGVASSPSGNVYVSGTFDGDNGPFSFGEKVVTGFGKTDMFVLKYSSGGTLLWAKSFGGPEDDYANSIEVDEGGTVWVVGSFSSSEIEFDNEVVIAGNGNLDAFVLKLGTNGSVNNAISYGGTGDDENTDISLAPNGEILISGTFTNSITLPGNYNLNTASNKIGGFALNLSLTGEMNWASAISSTGDIIYPVISAAGNGMAYLSAAGQGYANFNGDTTVSLGNQDLDFVAKITNTGNFLWVETVAGAKINDVHGGPDGEAVISGYYSNRSLNFGNKTLPEATNSTYMFLSKIGTLDVSPGIPQGP